MTEGDLKESRPIGIGVGIAPIERRRSVCRIDRYESTVDEDPCVGSKVNEQRRAKKSQEEAKSKSQEEPGRAKKNQGIEQPREQSSEQSSEQPGEQPSEQPSEQPREQPNKNNKLS